MVGNCTDGVHDNFSYIDHGSYDAESQEQHKQTITLLNMGIKDYEKYE